MINDKCRGRDPGLFVIDHFEFGAVLEALELRSLSGKCPGSPCNDFAVAVLFDKQDQLGIAPRALLLQIRMEGDALNSASRPFLMTWMPVCEKVPAKFTSGT